MKLHAIGKKPQRHNAATVGSALAKASQVLAEASAGVDDSSSHGSPDNTAAGLDGSSLSKCANQCFYAEKEERASCMATCMSAMATPLLGEAKSNDDNKPNGLGDSAAITDERK